MNSLLLLLVLASTLGIWAINTNAQNQPATSQRYTPEQVKEMQRQLDEQAPQMLEDEKKKFEELSNRLDEGQILRVEVDSKTGAPKTFEYKGLNSIQLAKIVATLGKLNLVIAPEVENSEVIKNEAGVGWFRDGGTWEELLSGSMWGFKNSELIQSSPGKFELVVKTKMG